MNKERCLVSEAMDKCQCKKCKLKEFHRIKDEACQELLQKAQNQPSTMFGFCNSLQLNGIALAIAMSSPKDIPKLKKILK
jgi:hypothetical protein